MNSPRYKIERWRASSAVVAVLSVLISARAQCTEEWLHGPGQGLPGVFGTVRAATSWDPDGAGPQPAVLVVGGEFTIAGHGAVANIAVWNGAAWGPLGPGLSGSTPDAGVRALLVYDGELIAAGAFTQSGGAPVNRIARWDGAAWQTLGGGANSTIHALTVYNGSLIAGGDFTAAGSANASKVARWDGASWAPIGAGVGGASVLAFTVFLGDLVAGGTFTTAGGTSAANIARWDGVTWQPMGPGFTTVKCLATFGPDLYAAGWGAIARWNGSNWIVVSVATTTTTDVRALAVYDGELVAAGTFETAGGVSARNIARWDGAVWRPLRAGIDGLDAGVHALAQHGGGLIAAGRFASAGGLGASGVARWFDGMWDTLGDGLNDVARAFTIYNGDLVAGGDFVAPGGGRGIARWDGSSWNSVGGGVAGFAPWVYALAEYKGDLIAGGSFFIGGAINAQYIARWDGANWHAMGRGFGAYANNAVHALCLFEDGLIAAGHFPSLGVPGTTDVARWDGSAWQSVGGGMNPPNISLTLRALAVYNSALIAGGDFINSFSAPESYLMRWNGSTWQSMSPGGLGVHAMTVYDGALIMGGFSVFYRWNGSSWAPFGGPGGAGGTVRSLAVHRGELFAAGGFTSIGGVPLNGIGRWNGATWSSLAAGVAGSYPDIRALTEYNDQLVVGGKFTTVGGGVSAYWARWGCACYPDCTGDGQATAADFVCFQSRFAAADPWADCNADGALTVQDFGCFQTKFVAGCP